MVRRPAAQWWALLILALSGCASDKITAPYASESRWVLSRDSANVAVLQFNRLTYAFEGGVLRRFALCRFCDLDSLPFAYSHRPAEDFGWELFRYVGTQDTVFYGTTIFMGRGKMVVPQVLLPPDSFQVVTEALRPPLSVKYFIPSKPTEVADSAWAAAQKLDITREFSRGAYRAGIFRYMPDAMGSYAAEKWIIFLYAGTQPGLWGIGLTSR